MFRFSTVHKLLCVAFCSLSVTQASYIVSDWGHADATNNNRRAIIGAKGAAIAYTITPTTQIDDVLTFMKSRMHLTVNESSVQLFCFKDEQKVAVTNEDLWQACS